MVIVVPCTVARPWWCLFLRGDESHASAKSFIHMDRVKAWSGSLDTMHVELSLGRPFYDQLFD